MRALDRNSVPYTLGFAAVVCLACAIPIAVAAVSLKPSQLKNQRVDRLSKVLGVAGLISPGERLGAEEIERRFEANVVPQAVALRTGEPTDAVDARSYDQRRAAQDPSQSASAPPNAARVQRVPEVGLLYHVVKDAQVQALILPIQGYGLWSTMYGYLALEADGRTVSGITFYEHGETPGLGGEVENPRWQGLWRGRKALDEAGQVKLQVIKGSAGPPERDPYRVDGISGATITSRGVSNTLDFWLGPSGFGPYLAKYRASREGASR
ncbi:MAG: Na(+)-translocating NADH-quinone reductase subunit C [Myxococcota bacterium]|nr:Na(+)-translocating NADH-quinone reductase subunit C [Myxococcota bacterium]